MSAYRLLDLFSGIGGFSLGLERSGGFETVAFCEIEPFCQRVLAKHWPKVPIYDDVRTLTAERLAADGIGVDAICGGFPCQDISTAGKGAGIDGERSGLWREYARIVGELRPRYVIVENVSALLGRGLDRVLGDLAALGYDAEWHCIPASAVGAPHQRDRFWLVADADGERQLQPQGLFQDIGRWAGDSGPTLADAGSQHAQGIVPRSFDAPLWSEPSERQAGPRGDGIGWWLAEPDVGRVAHGVPAELDGVIDAEEHHPAPSADRGSNSHGLSGVWLHGTPPAPSSELRGTEPISGALPPLPRQGGPEGRLQEGEGAEALRVVRQGVHANTQHEAPPLQPRMSLGDGAHQCREALGAIWVQEPDIPRVAQGVKARVDRLKSLGNAVVPQIPELIGRAIMAAERQVEAA